MKLVQQRFEFIVGDLITADRRRARSDGGLGSGASNRLGKLSSAMQLVEQCLEFFVGNFIAGRRRRRSGCRRCFGNRGCNELPLAVQLVQQRFELVISDFVATVADSGGHRSGIVERTEKLFEFIVGGGQLGLGHGDSNVRHGNRRIRTGRLSQTRQRCEQFRRSRSDLSALTHLAEHFIDGVQRLQHDIHQFRVDASFTLAQDVEDVFSDVTALDQLVQLEETGTAFYRVETAKNRIEQRGVVGAALQLHQLL